jgi:hypothetical protein
LYIIFLDQDDIHCREPEEVLGFVRTLKCQVLSLLGEMVALEDELVDVRERKEEILVICPECETWFSEYQFL